MLVQCTGCGTSYRIADEKVPESGVKVKCPKCRVVFLVRKEVENEPETLGEKLFGKDAMRQPLFGEGTGDEKAETAASRPDEEQAKDLGPIGTPRKLEAVEQPVRAESRDDEPHPQVEEKAPAPAEEAAGAPVEKTVGGGSCEAGAEAEVEAQAPPFRVQSDKEDPKNLARALISDVLFYNREKRDRGLAEGKVLAYLGKEIARSWELYKDRLGIEEAVGTEHFREAVNDILGAGKEIL